LAFPSHPYLDTIQMKTRGRCCRKSQPFTTNPPHQELTYSSRYPSKPFQVQPEEPDFYKCTEGTHEAECVLWFQDLVMLQSNSQSPPKKSLAGFLEPD